ncbi:protein FAR1-RELATED SEQUENCE 5-like [Lotus japonicus]|uniref:protein FAR1-RELATED SEQUENCE 5-like n=1 Tax=Lotus japonicus TaxID=34305 RepID=UPI0025885CE3|nr:protein FAR1-RELATED SEQUENCE 5-like [Lotus japonicus]
MYRRIFGKEAESGCSSDELLSTVVVFSPVIPDILRQFSQLISDSWLAVWVEGLREMENEREDGWRNWASDEVVEESEIEIESVRDFTTGTVENGSETFLEGMFISDEDEVFENEAGIYEDYVDEESFVDFENECHFDTDEDVLHEDDEDEQHREESVEPNLVAINSKEDYLQLDFSCVDPVEVTKFHFANVELAYDFYHWYGRIMGFSARRGTIRRNRKGEAVQQTFLCHRQGFREEKGICDEMRLRRQKVDFRCGCDAKFRVHIDPPSQRWYVTCFQDAHNHDLLPKQHGGLLAAHRKMGTADIMSMNSFMKSGISAPQIFNSFASQCGGYEKVGFGQKNMQNQLAKQRRSQCSDGQNAVDYIRWLGLNDELMFERHTEDAEHGVENLFWCDGISRYNYKVFGDVDAFDATYKKNKYRRPVVLFSGVDHHNRTIIFATAIVVTESEQTYVWLLEQFAEAMNQKLPGAVITDGALPMRNAIRRVFPNAHHRLCAWHLLKIANKRVGIPEFLNRFRTCMLSDYGIGEFKRRWATMVTDLELENNTWVSEMYDKREMWAATYFRGKFFAGFRTTSRCEGFHSQLLKFVRSRYNLTDFVLHFHRCLSYMRFKELEADFKSGFGDLPLQTNFRGLERSAARILTIEVFNLFVPVISLASEMIVTEFKRATGDKRYKVVQYRMESKAWNVYYDPVSDEFKCSCEKMETYGLPCEHILGVLVFLHITELPISLVSKRWTKGAKDCYNGEVMEGSIFWESDVIARYVWLVESCRELCTLASKSVEHFNKVKEKIAHEIHLLKGNSATEDEDDNNFDATAAGLGNVNNTGPVRRPRVHARASSSGLTTKRTIRCTACKVAGHNRLTCPLLRDIEYENRSFERDDENESIFGEDEDDDYEGDDYEDYEYGEDDYAD